MEDFMKGIRQELRQFSNSLEDDIENFNSKLNLTRKNCFNFLDQQIEYLKKMKNDFNEQFNYLEEENNKTYANNQQEFNRFCLTINKNDHDRIIIQRLIQEFKQKFSLRPNMVKSIPEYHFKEIQMDDFIIKQISSRSPTIDHYSSSSIKTESTSMIRNNPSKIESPSRLNSSCTTQSEDDGILDIIYQFRYLHDLRPHLMCFNQDEKYLVIYSFSSHQFQCLFLNSRQIISINDPSDDSIYNLGYSSMYHLFYCTIRQNNRFIFFRLNREEKEIEIDKEIELIHSTDHFINVHIYDQFIYYLYLTTSSVVMFGKYDLDNSSILPSKRLNNRFYENGEKLHCKILDFSINDSFICFLIQFKEKNKSKIRIHDYDSFNELHSFDLIDAVKPISIVSTIKKLRKSTPTMNDENETELLLYINDPDGRLIHCCTYQKYLKTIRVSNFAICSLDDGNLVLIAKKDIRILNAQQFLKINKLNFD